MQRTLTLLATATALTTLLACETNPADAPGPRVADLSTESHTTLFDRSAALAGATDPREAPEGLALDLAGAGGGYLLTAYDGEALVGAEDAPRTISNWIAGVAAVVAVDVTTALVVATPAIAVGIAAEGQITQTSFNVWEAENSIDLLGTPVTTHLTVAWVGVGWVSEMRITTDQVSDQLWFNGFVSADGQLGWWDFYENGTTKAGAVEWLSDGVDGEFGYGALTGEYAGDVVLYSSIDGVGSVNVYDASLDELVWVSVNPDESGSVRLVDYNGGLEACWDADHQDVACP